MYAEKRTSKMVPLVAGRSSIKAVADEHNFFVRM